MLSLLIFFLFFFFLSFSPLSYFLLLHVDSGKKQDSGGSRERVGLPGAGVPGKAVGFAANPEVFAATPFCTRCLLPEA